MATARLIPSTYYLSSTYLSVSNRANMYANTDSTNYATVTNTRSGTSSYYIYIRGFNFDAVPANATVSSITIKLKAYHSGGNTSTIYGYNGTTQVSSAGNTTALSTSAQVKTFTNTTIDWSTLKSYGDNFGIRINCRRSNRNNTAYVYIYGAEIDVEYSAETVHVTSVSLNKNSTSIEVEGTEQLTATVSPSNATDTSVSWQSSNTSVATVSQSGLVTGVSAGSATITVTTTDGSKTATCTVTVTQPVTTEYVQTNSLVPGKSYVIANGNSGSVYLLSNESGGSRQLVGVSATVTNGKLYLTGAKEAKCLFPCVQYTSGNSITTTLTSGNGYLYVDNSSGLRFNTSVTTLNRFWHYNGTKFWQFKSSTEDGYDDTSSEYKYYLTLNSSNNFTDAHVTSPSIGDTTLPDIYLFIEASDAPSEQMYIKSNGTWTNMNYTKIYKKVNGVWVEQSDPNNAFDSNVNYKWSE